MRLRHVIKPFARAILALSLLGGASAALADSYPDRPVKWVVPFPPGGAMDSIARTLSAVSYTHLTLPTILLV